MHRWLSTDNGDECYQCGLVLDYGHPASDCDDPDCGHREEFAEKAAHDLAPACITGLNRAHHFVLTGGLVDGKFEMVLDCAYGDDTIGPETGWSNPECVTVYELDDDGYGHHARGRPEGAREMNDGCDAYRRYLARQ